MAPIDTEEDNNQDDLQEAGEPEDANSGLVAPDVDEAADDAESEVEAEKQRALRYPGAPSQDERDAHDLTHIPFRPWCNACVRGRAKDKASLRLCGAYAQKIMIVPPSTFSLMLAMRLFTWQRLSI